METQGKITDKIREKCVELMSAALIVNDECRKRSKTGNKPTVFVYFYGHIPELSVDIMKNGYYAEYELCERKSYDVYLDVDDSVGRTEEYILKKLEDIIRVIENFKED